MRVTEVFPPGDPHELHMAVMDSLTNDTPRILQVNVPNRGALAGIADDVVVESKALVDASGIKLLHVGRLPDKLMQMVLIPRILKAEKELLAFRTGEWPGLQVWPQRRERDRRRRGSGCAEVRARRSGR